MLLFHIPRLQHAIAFDRTNPSDIFIYLLFFPPSRPPFSIFRLHLVHPLRFLIYLSGGSSHPAFNSCSLLSMVADDVWKLATRIQMASKNKLAVKYSHRRKLSLPSAWMGSGFSVSHRPPYWHCFVTVFKTMQTKLRLGPKILLWREKL